MSAKESELVNEIKQLYRDADALSMYACFLFPFIDFIELHLLIYEMNMPCIAHLEISILFF